MTEDQTTTELDPNPPEATSADALDSVSDTEQVIDREDDAEVVPSEDKPTVDDETDAAVEARGDAAGEVAPGEAAAAGETLADGHPEAEPARDLARGEFAPTSADDELASTSTGDGESTPTSTGDAAAATADALASVTETEQVVEREEGAAPADDELASTSTGDELASTSAGDEVASTSTGDGELTPTSTPTDEEGSPFGEEEGVLSGDEVVVDDETMRRALEAILMVTDEPLPVLTLARTVGRPTGDVTNALNELAGEYTEQGRGFDLREVGGGWRYYTRAEAAQYVERFVLDGQQSRLTQAALETLAVVAYKQPVSRARVSAIRGVNVDGVMRTLVSRGLVEEAGSDTESQATLYRTTSYFLERMGMQSLDDLPELAPYLPDMDDMEDELAAQNAPAPETAEPGAETEASAGTDEAVGGSAADAAEAEDDAAAGADSAAEQAVAEDESAGEELEPAEELEAGGDEVEPDVDPAEIPAVEEDADGNDDDDEGADFDAAEGDPEDDAADFDAATGDSDDLEDGAEEDDFDEGDESADEQLQAAEDLEAAGASEGFGEESVADGPQYGTEANDRDE